MDIALLVTYIKKSVLDTLFCFRPSACRNIVDLNKQDLLTIAIPARAEIFR